jgi:hypothetical protein
MSKTLFLAAILAAFAVAGDQVEMKNGDHYTGRILSVTAESVVLENEILGKLTLPRSKVTLLSVGVPAAPVAPSTNGSPASVKSNVPTGGDADIASALRQLGANTNFIARIRGQFLADAGPEANQKFDETLAGLTSGGIDLATLRAQAKSAADQLRSYQHDLGPDAGDTMNSYLTILDNFLRETGSSTNR